MAEASEAEKVAEEILEELHPWIKEWDYHYLQGRIYYVASVIQRLLDERDAEIERLQQQLALFTEAEPDCERCNGTGKIHYVWRTWWGGRRTDKEASQCPDCN